MLPLKPGYIPLATSDHMGALTHPGRVISPYLLGLIVSAAGGNSKLVKTDADGNLVLASGDGLKLNGSTAVFGRYDVGTWTPVLQGVTTAGTQTYDTQSGKYWRIGGLCFLVGHIALSAKDAAMAGQAMVTGLPFMAVTANPNGGAAFAWYSNLTGLTQMQVTGRFNGSGMLLFQNGNGSVGLVGATNITNTTILALAGFYECS